MAAAGLHPKWKEIPVSLNIYELQIDYIHRDFQRDAMDSVFKIFAGAIDEAHRRLEEVAAFKHEEWLEQAWSKECDLIESLIGCALVTCQAYIARFVSNLQLLHKRANKGKHKLTTTDGRKDTVMKSCRHLVAGTSNTQVQVINAFANYFKHRDEWPREWAKATGQAVGTIGIIQAAGANETATDNLQTCLRALGISNNKDLPRLADLLAQWHSEVCTAYTKELQGLGLI